LRSLAHVGQVRHYRWLSFPDSFARFFGTPDVADRLEILVDHVQIYKHDSGLKIADRSNRISAQEVVAGDSVWLCLLVSPTGGSKHNSRDFSIAAAV
jgi:hypothetical protein